jgi:hypothetical protein
MRGALLWTVGVLWAVLAAEARMPESAWRVRVELQVVRLPLARALVLVPQLNDERTGSQAMTAIEGDCLRGAAERMAIEYADFISGPTVSPRDAVVEQVEKHRYGMDYWQEIFAGKNAGKLGPVGYAVQGFTDRPAGTTFQCQGMVTDGGRAVALCIEAEWAKREGSVRFESGVRQDGTRFYTEQPDFRFHKTKTTIVVRGGVPFLTASYRVSEPRNEVELHVVRATIRPFGLPVVPAPGDPEGAPERSARWQIRYELQRFHVPADEALSLRPALLDATQVDGAASQLMALVASRRAELSEWLSAAVVTEAGMTSENAQECRYGMPPNFSVGYHGFVNNGADAAMVRRPSVSYYDGRPWLLVPGCGMDPATSYDLRNVGTGLDVNEASISSDGRWIQGYASAWDVVQSGFSRWGTGPDPFGKASYAYQPDFRTRKTTTMLTMADGQRMLFSFVRLPAPADAFEITLLRTTAARVPNFSPLPKS